MTAARREALNGVDDEVLLFCDGEGENGEGCNAMISDHDSGGWLKVRHARYVAHFRHGWYNISGRDLCFGGCRTFRKEAFYPHYLERRRVELIENGYIPAWNVKDDVFEKYRTRDEESEA